MNSITIKELKGHEFKYAFFQNMALRDRLASSEIFFSGFQKGITYQQSPDFSKQSDRNELMTSQIIQ